METPINVGVASLLTGWWLTLPPRTHATHPANAGAERDRTLLQKITPPPYNKLLPENQLVLNFGKGQEQTP